MNVLEKIFRKLFPKSWAKHDKEMSLMWASVTANEAEIIILQEMRRYLEESKTD